MREYSRRGEQPETIYEFRDRGDLIGLAPASGDPAATESSATADSFWLFEDGAFSIAYRLPGAIAFLTEQGLIVGDRKATVVVGFHPAGNLARLAVTMRRRAGGAWDSELPDPISSLEGSWRGETVSRTRNGDERPEPGYRREVWLEGDELVARKQIDGQAPREGRARIGTDQVDWGGERTILLPAGLSVTLPFALPSTASRFDLSVAWRVADTVHRIARVYDSQGWERSTWSVERPIR